jgi:hypothetical protein
MLYRRITHAVEAYRHTGEPREDWPQWLQDFKGYDRVNGMVGVAVDAVGQLLIPTPFGPITVKHGNWIVREPNLIDDEDPFTLVHMTDAQFHSAFEETSE